MRVGIIGTKWGRMHVGAFRSAGADVVALCGRDLERTRHVAREEGIPLATTQVPELVESVDVVVVASPDALHAGHVQEALRQHRAVLCEKPLARTWEEARRMEEAAEKAEVPCAVSFPYRQLEPLRALRAHVRGRNVRQLLLTLRNGFASDGDMLARSGDFGGVSHVLDAALWLAGGSPRWLQASLTGRPANGVLLHLGLSSGATVALAHVPCPEPGIHGAWSVLGDDWEAGFSAGYLPARSGWCLSPIRSFERGAWRTLADGDEPRPGAPEPWARAHVETARRFLQAASGGELDDLASFREGATVQRLLALAVESEGSGKRMELR